MLDKRRELELRKLLAEKKKYNRLPEILEGLNDGQRGFCNMQSRQSLMSGGNQQGKSHVGKAKAAVHITGNYPDWWEGPRLENVGDFTAFVSGVTAKTTRDLLIDGNSADTMGLLGPGDDRGSGLIPRDQILDIKLARGSVPGAVDHFKIRRRDGSTCTVMVFAYADGADRMQGYTPKYGFIDEEPKFEVYDELQARFLQSEGILDMVFTPLKGASQVYLDHEASDNRAVKDIFYYSIDMATHLTPEHRQRIIDSMANHPLREARLMGRPVVGDGLIFRTPDADITVEPFEIPQYFKRIIGIDFPHTTGDFAAASIAIDTNSDTWYLVDCYKRKDCERPVYFQALHAMGGNEIPVAWPHDGGRRDGDGPQSLRLHEVYRNAGLNLLHRSASRKTAQGKDSRAKTIWIEEVGERMATGRFKVFSTCVGFFKEKQVFRHERGKIVDGKDDILDALGKAVLSIDYAQPTYLNQRRSGTDDLADMLGGYDILKGGWGAH